MGLVWSQGPNQIRLPRGGGRGHLQPGVRNVEIWNTVFSMVFFDGFRRVGMGAPVVWIRYFLRTRGESLDI